jgi:hypothetical protein
VFIGGKFMIYKAKDFRCLALKYARRDGLSLFSDVLDLTSPSDARPDPLKGKVQPIVLYDFSAPPDSTRHGLTPWREFCDASHVGAPVPTV